MPDAGSLGTFEVWILAPRGADYGWSTSGWVKEPRLIPERFNRRTGNTGAASFRVLKMRRQEVGFATYRSTGQELAVGSWVVITSGNTSAVLDWSLVQWWGTLQATHDEPDQSLGYIGSATAAEVGPFLDTIGLTGWRAASNTGGSLAIGNPSTFNLNGEDGEVIGNRTTDSSSKETLCRTAGTCGKAAANLWTRYRLLNYLVTWLLPASVPVPTFSLGTGVETYLDDTDTPEVYNLKPLTVKGALDLCIPRPHGLGWRLNLTAAGAWRLDAWALLDAAEAGIPTQTATDVDLSASNVVKSISYDVNESTWYDEVEVLGAGLLISGSLAASDAAWVNKWATGTGSQEALWKAGSTESLVGSKLKDACAKMREGANVRDVFVRFGIGGYTSTGVLYRSTAPGGTAESSTLCWFPEVTWDGSALTVVDANSSDPLWTTARIERHLPWPIGVPGSITPGSGSDPRDATAKAQPSYLEPRVFIYDSTLTPSWRDLLVDEKHGSRTRNGASIECDDRGPDLRVRCSPPEWLAAGDWSGIVAPRIGVAGTVGPYGSYDYRKMVVTIAMRSDQRLRVVKRRAGITADQVRRRLVLEDDKLQAWYIHAGTVVGVKADGTPDRVTTVAWLRNDYPTAEKRARAAAAWALTTRYTATIVLARPDAPPAWADVGTLLGTITNGDTADQVNSVVEDVSFDLGSSPAVTITTDIPDGLTFGRGGGLPSSGGQNSLQLGATVPQAVSAVQQELGRVRRDLARSPVILPRPAQADVDSTMLEVTQTSHGFVVGDVLRSSGGTWVKAQADTAGNAVAIGIVAAVLSSSAFVLATGGYMVGLTGIITGGQVHYLSDTTAGAMTLAAPNIAVPVLFAVTADAAVLLTKTAPRTSNVWEGAGATFTYTTPGTYTPTVPAGYKRARFTLIGGGGGGAANTAQNLALPSTDAASVPSHSHPISGTAGGFKIAATGASGGFADADFDITPGETLTLQVGAGGAVGATGGDTSLTFAVGGTVTAKGGTSGGVGGLVTTSGLSRLGRVNTIMGTGAFPASWSPANDTKAGPQCLGTPSAGYGQGGSASVAGTAGTAGLIIVRYV